jgi:hypothetical protein
MDASLLGLPWQIQFSLAAGYAAYALAYIGIRSHHQTIDVAFRTLVFSAIATAVVTLLAPGAGPVGAAAIAFAVAMLSALIWRAWGRDVVRLVLHNTGFAVVDDDPTAFSRIYVDTKHDVTQAIVTMEDDTELWCDDTSNFRDAPIGSFSIGEDGSVAIYANRSCKPDGAGGIIENVYETVRDPTWGDRMTLVPASRVKKIELRFKKKP